MEVYDLVVVGAGSGLTVANVAADEGESVAVVEKGPLGGTCLNRGCIPSKELLYRADVRETIERAGEFHIDARVEDVAFAAMVQEVNERVGEEAEAIRRGITEAPEYTLYPEEARFVDERTLLVDEGDDETHVEGEKVVLAAGTRPSIPAIDGIEDVNYVTSTGALQLEQAPDELVIVGGGYIAAELAHFFGTFGSQVAIVGRRATLLPEADREVAEAFTRRYAERFDVHTGYEARAVEADGEKITVRAHDYEHGAAEAEGDPIEVGGDELLIAAGRRPNTDLLDVEAAGIATDAEGWVRTDAYLRTSTENVWALGDILGKHLFKHAANHEAQAVARNIYAEEAQPVLDLPMPFAVFASPEVAGVGKREEELDPEDEVYATSTYRYEDTARGGAMRAEGFVKVLIDEEGRILGCHVIGPDASSLVQEVVTAMTAGNGTIHDVLNPIHIHPALPEVVQRAFSGPYHLAGEHEHHHHHDNGEA